MDLPEQDDTPSCLSKGGKMEGSTQGPTAQPGPIPTLEPEGTFGTPGCSGWE